MRESGPPPSVVFHPASPRRVVAFGEFRFDWQDHSLTRAGQDVRLPPRALAVLAHLLARPGRLVTKQELMDAVWQDAFVGESSLTEAMRVLRQALGESAADARYIQTVHRRGYRFIAPIELPDTPPPSLTVASRAPVVTPAPEPPPSTPGRRPRALGLAVVAVAVAAGLWLWAPWRVAEPVTRLTITLPEAIAPAPALSSHTVLDLSPDGRRLVYVAGTTGSYRLYLRTLDQFEATPVPGTEGAHGAFFSPGGDRIAFFRRGRLLVTRVEGGDPIDIGSAGAGLGGWWHTSDQIYVATGRPSGILRGAAAGGPQTSVPVDGLDPASLRYPAVTPDGRTLLATQWQLNTRDSMVVAVDLTTGTTRGLGRGVHARPLGDHHVVFLRDTQLLAQPVAGGEPRPLLDAVMTGTRAAGQFALAANGTLAYLPDDPTRSRRRLVLIDRQGRPGTLAFAERAFQNIAVAPDGRRVATTIYDQGASDLWVGDFERGTLQRLTSEGGTIEPVWSPDGRYVYFASSRTGVYRLFRVPADGSGPAEALGGPENVAPTTVTSGTMFAQRLGEGTDDIVHITTATWTTTDWLATDEHEGRARLSPDGRWVAYEATRSGRQEVYLRAAAGGPGVLVTDTGGAFPQWAPDGLGLYVLARPTLWYVPIRDGQPGVPMSVREDASLVLVSPRGSDVVGLMALEESRALTTIHVVVNWLGEVRPHLR